MKINPWLTAVMLVLAPCLGLAEPPATAEAKPDYSSPEGTLRSLAQASAKHDLKAYRECWCDSDQAAKDFMEALADSTITMLKVNSEINAQFGPILKSTPTIGEVVEKAIAQGGAKINGDEAEIAGGVKGNSFLFTKINGQWKLDTARIYRINDKDFGPKVRALTKELPAKTVVYKQILSELEAKKFASIEELQKRVRELTGAAENKN